MDHESFDALRNPIKPVIEVYNFLRIERFYQIFLFKFPPQ